MPKMREVALEQKVNQLNAIVSQQADRISEQESLVRDMWTAYSTKADESFHPAWEVDVALLDRMRELGIEI